MEWKREGAALAPFPAAAGAAHEAGRAGKRAEPQAPRCEMCGAEVIATHCKRICLRCGFMTGCSEGI